MVKSYAEVANPSECFFQCKFKCLCWHSPLQKGQGHQSTPNSSRAEPVPLDVTGLPVHSLKSCASSKSLGHKQWSQPLPSSAQVCSHASNRCLQGELPNHATKSIAASSPQGGTYSRAIAFLVLLPPSLPSEEQRTTDGCHELHISCPFAFSSQQACKGQQELSLEGPAGPNPLSCHMAVVASAFFPSPPTSRGLLSSHTWKGKRGSICQSQSE